MQEGFAVVEQPQQLDRLDVDMAEAESEIVD